MQFLTINRKGQDKPVLIILAIVALTALFVLVNAHKSSVTGAPVTHGLSSSMNVVPEALKVPARFKASETLLPSAKTTIPCKCKLSVVADWDCTKPIPASPVPPEMIPVRWENAVANEKCYYSVYVSSYPIEVPGDLSDKPQEACAAKKNIPLKCEQKKKEFADMAKTCVAAAKTACLAIKGIFVQDPIKSPTVEGEFAG